MYLNLIELAESFGVAESVVEGWIRDEGLPCVRDRGRVIFDRAQVVSWAAEHGLAARAGFLAATGQAARAPGRLRRWLQLGGIWRDVAPAELNGILSRIIAALPGATPAVRQLLEQRLRAPGGITWAPVGGGLALPHLRTPVALGGDAAILALLFLREPLSAGGDPAPDGAPVTRLFFFIAPSPRAHLEMLAQLSAALTRGGLRGPVLAAAADEKIFAAIDAAEMEAEP